MELEQMIEIESQPQSPAPFDPEPFGLKRSTWWDLILYLFGGFGVYLLFSLLFVGTLDWLGVTELNLIILVISLLINVVINIGSPWVLGMLRKRISWEMLGLIPARWDWWYLLAVPGLAAVLYLPLNFIGVGLEYLLNGSTQDLEARSELLMLGGPTLHGFLIVWLLVGVLVPFAEEFYFRGLIYPWFRQRLGMWMSIVCSSFLFGLAHFDSVGAILQAFLMGAVMAYVFERTRSLYTAFLLHASINTASVVMLYFVMAAEAYY